MGDPNELFQLNRIANALESMVAADAIKSMNSDASTLYQLAGNAAGFADELDSVLNNSDTFKRAQLLRELQKKARRIANMYQEQADRASEARDSGLDSTHGQSETGIGEAVQGTGP